MERTKAVFNWSGGKDSAHALLRAQQSGEYEIVALLTTVNRDTHRSTMHGIPTALLQMQAESIGVPLYIVDLTPKGNMEDYDVAMSRAVEHFKTQGVTRFIFGDIFLHDVRKYREDQLHPLGIEVVEPLWNPNSAEVMQEFLASGIKTKIVVADAGKLDEAFIGQDISAALIDSMPAGIDVCGENGEYHTFAYAGGPFKHPVDFSIADVRRLSYAFKLDSGEETSYQYWQAIFEQ